MERPDSIIASTFVACLYPMLNQASWVAVPVLPVDGGLMAGNGRMMYEFIGEQEE